YVLDPVDETSRFDAPGEPGRSPSWRSVGAVDPHPRAYSFLAGGVQDLPPYQIYENGDALPRAFVVHHALPLADRPNVLAQLKATDFRREVLLEGGPEECTTAVGQPDNRPSAASIQEYLPNRVTVAVQGVDAGYLVLTDVWFPGWSCMVDGQPAKLYRANFLFRAVAVPAGNHEVVFVFDPASYRCGKW